MMHLSKDDHDSVARVKEVMSAEAARCNSPLSTVWEGLVVSLDHRLPHAAEVVELRLLHGGNERGEA